LPTRRRRAFSSLLNAPALRLTAVAGREKTAGTAERWARIFVDVSWEGENRGRDLRTICRVVNSYLLFEYIENVDAHRGRHL
jgi:hypothetical protein